MQMFTSKNTSVNVKKLPKVFSHLTYDSISKGTVIYDYGAGRHTDHIRAKVEREGLEYIPYDPHWVSPEEKYKAWGELKEARKQGKDVIFICSNVLNVIDSAKQILNLCQYAEVQELFDDFIFSIYEGDKSGIGRETKKDCWQRNERVQSYLQYFEKPEDVVVYKGFITSNKNLIK